MYRRHSIIRILIAKACRAAAACAVAACVFAACTNSLQGENSSICDAHALQRSRVEVTASGTVTRILGIREGPSGTHEGFLVRVPDCNIVIRVEHNVDIGGSIPLHQGEAVQLRGEYLYDPRGGIVHYTHHDPSGRHPGGSITAGGETYN